MHKHFCYSFGKKKQTTQASFMEKQKLNANNCKNATLVVRI